MFRLFRLFGRWVNTISAQNQTDLTGGSEDVIFCPVRVNINLLLVSTISHAIRRGLHEKSAQNDPIFQILVFPRDQWLMTPRDNDQTPKKTSEENDVRTEPCEVSWGGGSRCDAGWFGS